MSKWIYTITHSKALREAIEDDDEQLVVKCLLACYKELYDELSNEDRDWKGWDIDDNMEALAYIDLDDEDNINCALDDFYDLCDDLRAWIML